MVTDSDNGLSSVPYQAIIWTSIDLCHLDPKDHISVRYIPLYIFWLGQLVNDSGLACWWFPGYTDPATQTYQSICLCWTTQALTEAGSDPTNSTLYSVHENAINLLRTSDALWWQRIGSTLVQVMAWCLTAPSHYLNQCWLLTNGVLRHSNEINFTASAQDYVLPLS